ncbi:ParB/RepB/Spo0J family partition protein [Tersicoccus sp. Bi-70]|uniref:ParB/RepB/Spo0J family partition protein n=1 Tax=Tersicoccus sp. Bi-70 TaxID=1897634 RepID=UPI0009766CC3|nr:ParB/RepB/Spo0J family partition protein [Tersicoccus sp. Bi-70]OMH30628.1 hypothetical protein BGP79_11760 [Tersicoccus sp. Bi-70]
MATRSKKADQAAPALAAHAAVFDYVPAAAIRPHPRNVRVDVGDVRELAESIRSQGVLQPLTVAPHPDGVEGEWIVIAGHRRLTAARVAGLTEIPVIIRRDLTGEDQQISAMLVENLQRTDLTVMEEADGYQALLDFNWDVKRVAKSAGRSQTLVRDRLKLRKLPDTAQDRVASGSLTIEHALASLEFEGDEQTQERILNARKADLEYEIRRARTAKEEAALQALVEALLVKLDAGVTDLDLEAWALRSNGWTDIESVGTDLAAVEAGVKDGRLIVRTKGGRLWWAVRVGAVDDEETEEQRGAREEEERRAQREADLDAGLAIAGEAREVFLLDVVKKATSELATEIAHHAAVHEWMRDYASHEKRGMAHLLDVALPDDAGYSTTNDIVLAALAEAEPARALAVMAIADLQLASLRYHREWMPCAVLDSQLKALDILGYQLTDIEREAMAHWAADETERAS